MHTMVNAVIAKDEEEILNSFNTEAFIFQHRLYNYSLPY